MNNDHSVISNMQPFKNGYIVALKTTKEDQKLNPSQPDFFKSKIVYFTQNSQETILFRNHFIKHLSVNPNIENEIATLSNTGVFDIYSIKSKFPKFNTKGADEELPKFTSKNLFTTQLVHPHQFHFNKPNHIYVSWEYNIISIIDDCIHPTLNVYEISTNKLVKQLGYNSQPFVFQHPYHPLLIINSKENATSFLDLNTLSNTKKIDKRLIYPHRLSKETTDISNVIHVPSYHRIIAIKELYLSNQLLILENNGFLYKTPTFEITNKNIFKLGDSISCATFSEDNNLVAYITDNNEFKLSNIADLNNIQTILLPYLNSKPENSSIIITGKNNQTIVRKDKYNSVRTANIKDFTNLYNSNKALSIDFSLSI